MVRAMSIADRIKIVMGTMTQAQLAEQCGVTVQAVNQWLLGHTIPGRKNLRRIADLGKVDLDWLVLGTEPASQQAPQKPVFLGKDLPVFAAVEGGEGELVISSTPIDIVPRPWYLGEVRDGYAVIVTGESMTPAYDPGDMVIVNPRLPHMRGKDHIFIAKDEDGEFRASIKRLVKVTDAEWVVEQFNPRKTFNLSRSLWVEAKRIVGKYNV